MSRSPLGTNDKFQHLRAAIWELYPDERAVPRLRARIQAINSDVLAGKATLSEAGMARLQFLNERLRLLDEAN